MGIIRLQFEPLMRICVEMSEWFLESLAVGNRRPWKRHLKEMQCAIPRQAELGLVLYQLNIYSVYI
jgi:hypothetical protein